MESVQAGPRLADLVTILYRPRQTIRRILDGGGDRWTLQIVLLTFVCASVSDSDFHEIQHVLPGLSQTAIIALAALALLAGGLFWILLLFLISWVVTLVGRVLGGTGSAADVRAALAWSIVPAIWSVIYRIPEAIYKSRFHVGPNPDPRAVLLDLMAHGGCAVAVILLMLQLGMFAWTLYIGSNTLGEAQRFSSWKGLANLALAVLLPIVVISGAIFTLRG